MPSNINTNTRLPTREKLPSGLLFCCSIIACITFIAFLPSLENGFTNWDDDKYVVDNPDIKDVTLHNLAKISSSNYLGNYQPLTMLTYMVEYSFFNLNPAIYHCTNLLLHIINCLLVFALIYGLSGSYITSLLVALLFAIHPMRVESVAWIAERKDVLSAFFYFFSLLFYIKYLKRETAESFTGSVCSRFCFRFCQSQWRLFPLPLDIVGSVTFEFFPERSKVIADQVFEGILALVFLIPEIV